MKRRLIIALFPLLILSWAFIASCGESLNDKAKTTVTLDSKDKKADEKPKAAAQPFVPELDRAVLQFGDRTIKPTSVLHKNLRDRVVGDVRIRVDGETVRAFKVGDEQPHWTAKVSEMVQLVWIAADAKTVYLAGYKSEEKSQHERPEAPARVRRLEIASGKWLGDLVVGGKLEPTQTEMIETVLVGKGHVVILSTTVDDDKGFAGVGQLIRYRVSCFKEGEVRPLWSKTFTSAGKVARSGVALLWAVRAPEQAQDPGSPPADRGAAALSEEDSPDGPLKRTFARPRNFSRLSTESRTLTRFSRVSRAFSASSGRGFPVTF